MTYPVPFVTNGPMDQRTSGPMKQWTDGPMQYMTQYEVYNDIPKRVRPIGDDDLLLKLCAWDVTASVPMLKATWFNTLPGEADG